MDASLSFGLAAFGSLFAIVDPFAALPVYLALTGADPDVRRRATAARASVTVLAVLFAFGTCGELLFRFFGITLPAFKIAGGILLFSVAFDMLQTKVSSTRSTPEEERDAALRRDVGLMPVGIPLLAGPGAIASSMVLAARVHSVPDRVALYSSMLAVAFVTWLVLRGASGIARVLGRTGMNIIARLMGLILAAVAVQFVVDGIRAAFPRLVGVA